MFRLSSPPSRSIIAPSSSSRTAPSTDDNQYNSDVDNPTWDEEVYSPGAWEHAYGEEEDEELGEEIVCTTFLIVSHNIDTLW